jgi:hypothetical protein
LQFFSNFVDFTSNNYFLGDNIMPLTEEEKIVARKYALNKAEFMLVPTALLRNLILQNHPSTIGIIDPLKIFLLEGKPIHIEAKMVIQYCDGTLDDNNTWLFDQGNIKVVPEKISL